MTKRHRQAAGDCTVTGPRFRVLLTASARRVLAGPMNDACLPALVALVAEVRAAGTASGTVQLGPYALRIVRDRDGGVVVGALEDFAEAAA